MSDVVNELSAYLGLIVQHVGGEVRISFEEAERGLPPNQAVKISLDEDAQEIVFAFVSREEMEEEVEQE